MEQVSISPATGKKIKTNGKLLGTCFCKKNGKWLSSTKLNGKNRFLGYYNTELEAHEKYLKFWEEVNKNKEVIPENHKYCSKCNQLKNYLDFHKNKNSPDGHYSWCKECKSEKTKKNYVKGKRNEYAKNYTKVKYHSDLTFKIKHNLRKRLSGMINGKFKKLSHINDLGCTVEELIKYIESKFYTNSNGIEMNWNNWGRGRDRWQIDHIIELHSVDLTNKEDLAKVIHYTNLQPLWHDDHVKKTERTWYK